MPDTKNNVDVNDDKRELRILNRNKTAALLARETVIKRIKAISDASARLESSPELIPNFLISVEELDSLWESFLLKNHAVLEALLDLELASDFDTNLETEIRAFYHTAMTVADQHRPQAAAYSVNGSINAGERAGSVYSQGSNPMVPTSGSRLPEIPLPIYSGDLTGWPVFRDRFKALVVNRGDLSNIERFYYLLGCLRGESLDTISSINVSDDTYELAWTTLSDRFDKPRQLATIIVNKLLSTIDQSTETLDGLKQFLSLYSDQVSLLRTLSVPDLGEFLLFSIATRCLPMATRKGFEATNVQDFPTMSDLIIYVKNRVFLLEAVSFTTDFRRAIAVRDKPNLTISRSGEKRSKTSLVTSDSPITSSIKCLFCAGNHKSVTCPNLVGVTVEERYHLAKEKRICFRCLDSTHWSNKCKVSKPCQKCSGRHHTLLHKGTPSSKTASSRNIEASLVGSADQLTVLLGTALVHIRDKYGCMQIARVLIDSASQISVMSSACAERLGLRRSQWTAPVSGLSGVPVPNVKGIVSCYITPRHDTKHSLQIQAWVLPNVTNNMPSCNLPSHLKARFSDLALADPYFDKPAPIDLLLGADVFSQILDGKRFSVDNRTPAAFSSLFGWIVIGPVNDVRSDHTTSNLVSLTVSLEDMIHRFWHLEEPDVAPLSFTENGKCEEIYISARKRNEEGRFEVPLPFKYPSDTLSFPDSKQLALRRFQNLERKLQSNEVLYENYRKFMHEYEALGHMSVASTPGSYFIPHHAVFKGAADSGKLRVVFDASAETSSTRSLNSCLFTGPKLQKDIVDILLRFRLHQVAFTADVCKMYRQILVLPQHRTFQHIFWRPSPFDEIREFELNTVTYGLSCAPFLALRVLQDTAEQECQNLPDVRDALMSQTYVDDICVGSDTISDLLKLQSDLKQILARASFELKKWISNSPEILATVPAEDRVSGTLEFDSDDGAIVKVLGLQWDSVRDTFSYNVNSSYTVLTKRSVLSTIARIFDPLGLLAPVTFLAKHVMQQVWRANLSWDDTLPTDLSDWWSSFVSELPTLSKLSIRRYVSTLKHASVQLCGFCDASERGYSAVVYLRVPRPNKTFSVSLLGCKTKMSPLKPTTIPRLELCAAYLLSRWMSRIQGALTGKVIIDSIHAWSDSQVVLSWLANPHTDFKVFVSNRVNQIKQMLPQCQWHYVRSSSNPADCASRGLMPSELLQHVLYWSGPDFLCCDESTWEYLPDPLPLNQLLETKVCALTVELKSGDEWFSRFSSFKNMLRVVSWMRRFIGSCRRQVYASTFLCPSELDQSLKLIVRCSQQSSLSDLYVTLKAGRDPTRSFASLSPYIDAEGLIRVGGRLRHAELPTDMKNPLLLSKSSHLSTLIARHWHFVTFHSGPRIITSLIIRQFWILSVRVVIRRVIGSCTTCVRNLARPSPPMMADLPSARVLPSPPFSRVGVDYAGPLLLRECSLRKSRQFKAYLAIFVCMAVKAVHLEVVLDLSTDAFLAALDRFVARCGLPQEIFSDCGTNLVGAARQLSKLVNQPHNRDRFASHQPCHWNFNPPSAPQFGGLWEAAVKSTKTLLIRVMGTQNLTLEELSTVLCRIEAVLNSRPLTPMSSSPLDLDYLTPGHFLIGRPLVAVPELNVPDNPTTLLRKWKLLHQCSQVFWRRWSTEYLCLLQAKSKWTKHAPNLKVGDMVIIKDNNQPPTSWRMGRIVDTMPGKDGVVRVVRVLTATGEITRPVIKLVLLPME